MEISVSGQLSAALWALACGGVFGALYDLLRALRRRAPGTTDFCDALVSLFGCGALVWLAAGPGGGELRLYHFAAAGAGAALYFAAVSPLLLPVFVHFLAALCTFFGLLRGPLSLLAKNILKIEKKLKKGFQKSKAWVLFYQGGRV